MIKHFLPKTLFGRALLIVVLPTVFVQAISAYIFYDRHWDSVTRNMAEAMAGEVAMMAYQAVHAPKSEREAIFWVFEDTTGVRTKFDKASSWVEGDGQAFPDLVRSLSGKLDMPFTVARVNDGDDVEVRVRLADGVLVFTASKKRLESPTTNIFIYWMTGSAMIFLLIALLFLRNQVRPIRQLAEAAESFGKGGDMLLKPHGAQEVRRAARAFLVMRERILRQIRTRTEMLAGISHDLRTPLTRMKLQLAMLGDSQAGKELASDVAQMEHMIGEYLDFARGDAGEEAAAVSLSALLSEVADDYRRMGHEVPVAVEHEVTLSLRVQAMRRLLHNLIDNALRYGKECRIAARVSGEMAEIMIDDKGPGIPEAAREEVFRPFVRLDASRNPKTGGVGLGLSIARDVALGHGGKIVLADAPGGGLRVIVRLPV